MYYINIYKYIKCITICILFKGKKNFSQVVSTLKRIKARKKVNKTYFNHIPIKKNFTEPFLPIPVIINRWRHRKVHRTASKDRAPTIHTRTHIALVSLCARTKHHTHHSATELSLRLGKSPGDALGRLNGGARRLSFY